MAEGPIDQAVFQSEALPMSTELELIEGAGDPDIARALELLSVDPDTANALVMLSQLSDNGPQVEELAAEDNVRRFNWQLRQRLPRAVLVSGALGLTAASLAGCLSGADFIRDPSTGTPLMTLLNNPSPNNSGDTTSTVSTYANCPPPATTSTTSTSSTSTTSPSTTSTTTNPNQSTSSTINVTTTSPNTTASTINNGNTVYVVSLGDSITYQTQYYPDSNTNDGVDHYNISNVMNALGARVSTASGIGNTLDETLHKCEFTGWPKSGIANHQGPNIAITFLGTNDLNANTSTGLPPYSLSTVESEYDTYLAQTGADCNVYVTLAESPSWQLNRADTGSGLNAWLKTKPGVIADWGAMVAADPTLVGSDGVHPTLKGRQALRTLEGTAAQACDQDLVDQQNATTTTTVISTTTTEAPTSTDSSTTSTSEAPTSTDSSTTSTTEVSTSSTDTLPDTSSTDTTDTTTAPGSTDTTVVTGNQVYFNPNSTTLNGPDNLLVLAGAPGGVHQDDTANR